MQSDPLRFGETYARLIDTLHSMHPGWIENYAVIDLRASHPDWTESGLALAKGQEFTVFAAGQIRWSSGASLLGFARYHLWGRIHGGEIFRFGSDTRTLRSPRSGALELRSHYGSWATPRGVVKSHPTNREVQGGFSVLVIAWGKVTAKEGLQAMRYLFPSDPLVTIECSRLECPRNAPRGFAPLWFVGDSDIFYEQIIDDQPMIAIRAAASSGIVRKPVQLELEPDTHLEWSWRVNRLPSRVPENELATHDYASIAVEFDDGQDLTWYWSASLRKGTYFRCPIPRWTARETHVVVRSGTDGLGTWVTERVNVYADAVTTLGRAPKAIVAVWLIAVSVFQRDLASVDIRHAVLQHGHAAQTVIPGP